MTLGPLLLAVVGLSAAPLAASAAPAPAPARTEDPPAAAGLVLVVPEAPEGVDAERLRDAIGRELGVPVTLSQAAPAGGALVLRAEEGRRAVMTYHAEDGRVMERQVDLPGDPAEAEEILALLAGNLVRDEAAEIAAALRARRRGADRAASPPRAGEPRASRPAPSTPAQAPPAPAQAASCGRAGVPRVFAGVDVVPHLGSSTVDGVNVVRNVSVNLLTGKTAGLDGVEVGGLVNLSTGGVCGVQLAGIANIGRELVRGWQAAVAVNFGGLLDGVQTAGGVNIAAEARGLQLAPANIAVGPIHGAQLGLVNVAAADVQGAQIGLVNVAPTSDFSLGLLNILWRGRLHLDLWGMESGILMLGAKHGGDHFHNIYGAGVRPGPDGAMASFALGLGGHFPLSGSVFMDTDSIAYSLHSAEDAFSGTLMQARALLGVSLARAFALYAGPTFNMLLTTEAEPPELSRFGDFRLHEGEEGYALRSVWPGLTLGVQAL